jgi:hypothetical protein
LSSLKTRLTALLLSAKATRSFKVIVLTMAFPGILSHIRLQGGES